MQDQSIRDIVVNNLLLEARWKMLMSGLSTTIIISILSIFFAVLIGCFLCRLRLSKNPIISNTTRFFINIIRALPPLILLLLLVFVVFTSLNNSLVTVSVFAFSLYFGAFFAEAFRSGINTVGKGQIEAAYAVGMSKHQTFRKIVATQALIKIMPILKSLVSSLIKSTSLVGFVSIIDLTMAGNIIRSRTFNALFPLLLVALLYFLLTTLAGFMLDLLNKRLTKSSRMA